VIQGFYPKDVYATDWVRMHHIPGIYTFCKPWENEVRNGLLGLVLGSNLGLGLVTLGHLQVH